MKISKNFGLRRAKQLYKAFNGKGGLIRRHFTGCVYLFKPEDSAYFVYLRFRKSEIYCRMAISRNGKFDISVSPKELYKVYQYINECIIKEKAYDSRNNNQEE